MAGEFWLDDRQWAAIEPLLPKHQSGAHRKDDRRIISGIIHVLKAGCRLAGLPGDVRPADDHLQPLSSLGRAWDLAWLVRRAGGGRSRRCPDDRQHHRESTPFGGRRKRGAEFQAIGRSRGGRTTKIHAVVDGCGRPVALQITPGQRGDAPIARSLIEPLPAGRLCAADTAYDSDPLRRFLIERGTQPVIPNNPTRKHVHPFNPQAYSFAI